MEKVLIKAKLRNQGRDFEKEAINEFKKVATDVQEQLTIVTKDGTKIRVDAIGYDKNRSIVNRRI